VLFLARNAAGDRYVRLQVRRDANHHARLQYNLAGSEIAVEYSVPDVVGSYRIERRGGAVTVSRNGVSLGAPVTALGGVDGVVALKTYTSNNGGLISLGRVMAEDLV
jgi:hypothetical protein